jgi:hypothetical protein
VSAGTIPQWLGDDFDEEVFFDDDGDFDEIEGVIAEASGTVRRFNVAEVEGTLGVDLDDSLFGDFEGDPVLVANSIRFLFEAEDVAANIDQYWGQRIAVAGEVSEVLGPRAFVLNDDLLVMARRDLQAGLNDGQSVAVRGTVREFDLEAFEQALGRELDDSAFADRDDRPVIVATSVRMQ